MTTQPDWSIVTSPNTSPLDSFIPCRPPGADLPTARLRQMRDGHDPDDANHGRARTARIARLQADIVAADELVVELGRYRILAVKLEVRPDVKRLIDREVRDLVGRTIGHRDLLRHELRALQ